MLKHHLPAIGIAVALCLFVVAAHCYAGGTADAASTVGFSWAHNFLCSLFRPRALNGAENPARYFAIPAIFLLCVSLGVMFKRISIRVQPRVHRKTIEIGGIGSAVYGFLVVTPIHNLMVNIGLLFSLAALLATTHALYLERRWSLFGWGAICISLALLGAAMYYGNIFFNFLPVVQKVSLVACIGFVIAVHYTLSGQEGERMSASKSLEPAR
jgi:hypothetical protein